jgi:hypothetical protein
MPFIDKYQLKESSENTFFISYDKKKLPATSFVSFLSQKDTFFCIFPIVKCHTKFALWWSTCINNNCRKILSLCPTHRKISTTIFLIPCSTAQTCTSCAMGAIMCSKCCSNCITLTPTLKLWLYFFTKIARTLRMESRRTLSRLMPTFSKNL